MCKKNFIFIGRVVCLVGLSIGLYKTDFLSALMFLLLIGLVFWAIPESLGRIFYRTDETKYDGEVMYKVEENGDQNCVLRIYKVADICKKKELTIKVSEDVRALNTSYNDGE